MILKHFYIDEDNVEKLEKASSELNKSQAQIVRNALTAHFNQKEQDHEKVHIKPGDLHLSNNFRSNR